MLIYMLDMFAASSYLLNADEYSPAGDDGTLRARAVREPDAHSLITMLGKRTLPD